MEKSGRVPNSKERTFEDSDITKVEVNLGDPSTIPSWWKPTAVDIYVGKKSKPATESQLKKLGFNI